MPETSRSEKCCIAACCISILIIIASIILGSIGAANYVSVRHDQLVYKPTMCFVKNYTIVASTCSRQNCVSYGLGSRSCTTEYYTCYPAFYTVLYNVSNGREIESVAGEADGPGSNSVNQTYQCFYDSTDETAVRWTRPNPYPDLIMLCVGWSIVGFYVILAIGLIIASIIRVITR